MFEGVVTLIVFSGMLHAAVRKWWLDEAAQKEKQWQRERLDLYAAGRSVCRRDDCVLARLEECCADLCSKHCRANCESRCCTWLGKPIPVPPPPVEGQCGYAGCGNRCNPNCSANSCVDHCYAKCEKNTWPNMKH